MIGVDQRSLLTDALTPPAGLQFEAGLATAYSLDLVTLLGVPLHLAWLSPTRNEDHPVLDPLPALEAMRRVSGNLTVFCQRGGIHIPRLASPLLGLLESMVHEVTSRHQGVFHPKVWLLKFSNPDSGEVRVTLLVLSRNITDDHSWDISLQLNGRVGRKDLSGNRPIRDLFRHAASQSHKPLDSGRGERMEQLLKEVMRCEWALPGNFEEVRFHLLGAARAPVQWLPRPDGGAWDELGVVSPFVTAGALDALARLARTPLFAISRAEELQKVASRLPPNFGYRVLREQAVSGDEEDDVPGRQRGLHAKAYVGKRGWNTHLFVGSANATTAALLGGLNTEFMAELIGRASKVGRPEDWLSGDGLGDVLQNFEPLDEETAEDPVEAILEAVRKRVAAGGLEVRCREEGGDWLLDLGSFERIDFSGAMVSAWPVSVPQGKRMSIPPGVDRVAIGPLVRQEVTSFVAFRVALDGRETCFALDLPIDGMPADRDMEILRSVLRNRQAFIRYLLLLLGDWQPFGGTEGAGKWAKGAFGSNADEPPVFELLARALAREPARLRHVQDVVDRIRAESVGDESVLPADFLKLWESFESVLREHAK
jgi:hypothetical protein